MCSPTPSRPPRGQVPVVFAGRRRELPTLLSNSEQLSIKLKLQLEKSWQALRRSEPALNPLQTSPVKDDVREETQPEREEEVEERPQFEVPHDYEDLWTGTGTPTRRR